MVDDSYATNGQFYYDIELNEDTIEDTYGPNLFNYFGEKDFDDPRYGAYNAQGNLEKGSGETREFKDELEEISRTPQTQYGEPSGSGSRQAVGTVKAFILDKFQEMYNAWEPQTPEGEQYQTELGDLIKKIESIADLDDKRYFSESQLEE